MIVFSTNIKIFLKTAPYMRILKSIDFTGKFQKPEFKPMIKNLPEELHQGSINNQKVQNFVPVLLEGEKCSKTFCKIFKR